MSIVIQLINQLNELESKCEKLKTAEKAEAIEIKHESTAMFKVISIDLTIFILYNLVYLIDLLLYYRNVTMNILKYKRQLIILIQVIKISLSYMY